MTLYEDCLKMKPEIKKPKILANGLSRPTFLCLVREGFSDLGRRHMYSRRDQEDIATIDKSKLTTAIHNGSIWVVNGLGPKRIKEICDWLEDERQIP